MDSLLFSDYDDFLDHGDRINPGPLDLANDHLYYVSYRWWNEARQAMFGGGSDELNGTLYAATSSIRRAGVDYNWDGDFESEIEVRMMRESDAQDGDCDKTGSSGAEFALVSEWMFLRALKWHNDVKDVVSILSVEDMQDLFPLQIRLSFLGDINLLVVKIRRKDNKVGAFIKASDIFCTDSGLLHIWDFSGQTTQFFIDDRKVSNNPGQSDEEVLLELQVYGISCFMKDKGRKVKMSTEGSKMDDFFSTGSLKMNGSTDNENLYSRVDHRPTIGSSYQETCNVGLTGLCNLGNTCFMNSAIQCLVHTPKLVDYFLGDFRKDLNFENPLGMNGKLALAFGDLLRKLWAPGRTPVAPRLFKSTLTGFAPQFSGYNQHDSQEFLSFLLDGLHEDLNRVKYKPYIEVKDAEGLPDEVIADEHWQNHLARNNSIVVDFCQGQYQSTLVCPLCQKKSITFDPFMYLSLPLPSTTMRTMTLTVLSSEGNTLPCPVTVTVPNYGRYKDLLLAIGTMCSLRDDETLLVAEVYSNQILRFLDKLSDSIELIRDEDVLVAYRLPKDNDASLLVVFMHQMEQQSSIHINASYKLFGIPLVARVPDLSKGSEIRNEFVKLLNPFLMLVEDPLNNFGDANNSAGDDTEMEDVVSVADGDSDLDDELVDDCNDFRFYLDDKKKNLPMNEPVSNTGSSRSINILVTWPDKMAELYDTSLLNFLPKVCNPGLSTKNSQESVSLYKCLEAFLKEEPLGPEDMWYCPTCKKHRQASKKLDLWRLPDVLVIHLKRFSYNRYFKNKLETFVDFPIDDFDLSSYIVHKNSQVSHHYMLYAASNHYGGMGGGHYTAFIQHGGRWYEFDDTHVYPASEENIKTPAAYVLFYRRISDV